LTLTKANAKIEIQKSEVSAHKWDSPPLNVFKEKPPTEVNC